MKDKEDVFFAIWVTLVVVAMIFISLWTEITPANIISML